MLGPLIQYAKRKARRWYWAYKANPPNISIRLIPKE